jgi:hypothetical protein
MFKKLKKLQKAFVMLLVLLVSGLIPTGLAIAAELVAVPEFEAGAENGIIEVTSGTRHTFNIKLSYSDGNQNNTRGTITLNADYYIQGNNSSSDSEKTVNFAGATLNTSIGATLDVTNASPGLYTVPIKISEIKNTGNGRGNELENATIDNLVVRVLPGDTDSPVVTISNPVNEGYYQSEKLPATPEFTVADQSTYTSSISGWITTEGTHTVTVSATDKYNNTGSASATYTVDNTIPVITSELVDGGVYNTDYLKDKTKTYYTIDEPNLDTSSADELSLTPGMHTVNIKALDRAGNEAEKTITYIIDNEAPTISFKFVDGGFYSSAKFESFNPYYEVKDDNPDHNSIEASTPVLSEGQQSVTVSATDKAKNQTSATATYTIDDTDPTVTINLEAGKYYNASTLSAVGEFYHVADLNILRVEPIGFGSTDGQYTASVTAWDKANNATTKYVEYVVDTTKPLINIDSSKIANNGHYKSSYLQTLTDFYTVEDTNKDSDEVSPIVLTEGTHTLNITATDKAGNSETETITYTVDNSAPTITFNLTQNSYYNSTNLPESYYSTSDNYEVVSVVADSYSRFEGTHELTVTAMDAAGNSTTATIKYTVDDTAPVVAISLPQDGGYYNSSALPEEPTFSVTETYSYITKLTGYNIEADGNYTVTITAIDPAGNQGSASVSYTIDNILPKITSKIVDGGYYNAVTLQEMGKYYTVEDANIEEKDIMASDLKLSEGNHTATITAIDKAGNESTETINYTVDNTVPEIKFNFENGGYYTSVDFKTFEPFYTVTDDNLDESTITASEVSFAERENQLTASAYDLAKNFNSATANYTIDDTVPEVTIHLIEGKYYNQNEINSVTNFYTAKDLNMFNISASGFGRENGDYSATVTATDLAGNTTTKNIDYHVDTVDPVITIDSTKLDNEGFYKANYLENLENFYNVADENIDKVKVSPFEKENGTYSFTITATDKAGNSATTSLSYTVDNTAPTVKFTLDKEYYQSVNLPQVYYTTEDNNAVTKVDPDELIKTEGTHTLKVTAWDAAGNSTTESITYTVDDTKPIVEFHLTPGMHYTTKALNEILAEKESYYSATDKYLANVVGEELQTSEGVHTLTVTAIDKAGNETVSSITYTVDNTAPVFGGLQGLVNGQRFLVGQEVDVTPVVKDNLDADLTVESTNLDTSKAGAQTVTITATDKAGNTSTFEYSYHVYNYSGVLQPVKADGSSTFKKNSTVPVKFHIADGNLFVKDATATIQIVKITNNVAGEPVDGISTSAASEGNLFRYDTTDNQYIFNLGTKTLEEGQYKALIVVTIDGIKVTKESQTFSIKK